MFVNSMPRYEILSDEAMDVLDHGWRRIVSEPGVDFMLPEAVGLFRRLRPIGGGHMAFASVYGSPFVRESAQWAARIWRATLEAYEPPPIDAAVRAQLQEFAARRRKELVD